MARRDARTAESIADYLLTLCPDEMPVDLRAISRELGVAEIRHDRMVEDGRVDWAEGQPVITLRSDRRPARQRFTLAHELAHVVLADRDRTAAYRLAATDQDDEEAVCDAIAAALLMPRPWISRRTKGHPIDLGLLRRIEQEADVSLAAAAARLTDVVGCTSALLRWVRGKDRESWICQFTSAVPSALYGRIRLPPTSVEQITALTHEDSWISTAVSFNGIVHQVEAQISRDRTGCLMLITKILSSN